MRGPLALATVLVVALVSTLACTTSYPPCYRGEYEGCVCTTGPHSGAHGYQACNVTEDGFGACTCDGTTPGIDAGREAGSTDANDGNEASLATDAAEASVGAAYMTACDPGGACAGAGAICFDFTTKGKVCTKPCTTAGDCPAPSPGCGVGQGVCRAP